MRAALEDFKQLSLGRLCAFLRGREPDAMIGYSILIYRLSTEDVENALHGPIAIYDTPEVKGAVKGKEKSPG